MLLHCLGMEHRKPKAISRQLDPAKQAAFIKRYEALMNQLEADEAVMFADAVHPTHAVRPVGRRKTCRWPLRRPADATG